MKDITLGEALRKARGLLKQLDDMLSGRDAEAALEALGKFMRKTENPWGITPRNDLYQYLGEEEAVGEAPFVAREHFIVDESPGALVKIGYMNNAFQEQFLPIVEERPGIAHFAVHQYANDFTRTLPAVSALVALECSCGARLAHIWNLLRKQRGGGGEARMLSANLDAKDGGNVFYAYGMDGHLWFVYLRWGYRADNNDDGGDFHHTGWGIYAWPLGRNLPAPVRIFSLSFPPLYPS